jgi:hypothetical protein
MSDGISISFVDFAAPLLEFDRVRCALARSFLVRSWCGPRQRKISADDETARALNRFVERSVNRFAKHTGYDQPSGAPVAQVGRIISAGPDRQSRP